MSLKPENLETSVETTSRRRFGRAAHAEGQLQRGEALDSHKSIGTDNLATGAPKLQIFPVHCGGRPLQSRIFRLLYLIYTDDH